jgi:sugar lactone lactonase YvrE
LTRKTIIMKRNYVLLAAVVIAGACSCKKSGGGGNHQTGLSFSASTLSGNGTQGFVNGGGTIAEFNAPFGVAVDAHGNVYVADEGNNCIRKIAPDGTVSTLAGSGVAGYADGAGASAQFNAPDGVALDAQANVYVADVINECIRKITPAGMVTTVAGMPQQEGYADGPGATAQFAQPIGIAVDGQGNIFVGDNANEIVRKITPAGVVSTVAGSQGNNGFADGTGSAAMFDNLMGVAVDGQGNVFVADVNNNRIRKIASGGVVSTLAGQTMFGHADGTGSAAMFEGPAGVATDGQGNIYVADAGGECIRKITASAVVSTLAGDPLLAGFVEGVGSAAKFDNPTGVAIDGQGNIYVADNINNRIRKITAQ